MKFNSRSPRKKMLEEDYSLDGESINLSGGDDEVSSMNSSIGGGAYYNVKQVGAIDPHDLRDVSLENNNDTYHSSSNNNRINNKQYHGSSIYSSSDNEDIQTIEGSAMVDFSSPASLIRGGAGGAGEANSYNYYNHHHHTTGSPFGMISSSVAADVSTLADGETIGGGVEEYEYTYNHHHHHHHHKSPGQQQTQSQPQSQGPRLSKNISTETPNTAPNDDSSGEHSPKLQVSLRADAAKNEQTKSPRSCCALPIWLQTAPRWLKVILIAGTVLLLGSVILVTVGLLVALRDSNNSSSAAQSNVQQQSENNNRGVNPIPPLPVPPVRVTPSPTPVPNVDEGEENTTGANNAENGNNIMDKEEEPEPQPEPQPENDTDTVTIRPGEETPDKEEGPPGLQDDDDEKGRGPPKDKPDDNMIVASDPPTTLDPSTTTDPQMTPDLDLTTMAPTTELNPDLTVVYFTGGSYRDTSIPPEGLSRIPTRQGDSFLVQLGDWNRPDLTRCEESAYQEVDDFYANSSVPVYFLVGDNEFNDCPDPSRAFQHWKEHLVDYETKYWPDPDWKIFRQGDENKKYDFYGTNFDFVNDNRIAFSTLTLPGGPIHDAKEFLDREDANYEWVDSGHDWYQSRCDVYVLMVHDAPPGSNVANRVFFTELFDKIENDYNDMNFILVHPNGYEDTQHKLETNYNGIPNLSVLTVMAPLWPPLQVTFETVNDEVLIELNDSWYQQLWGDE